MANALYGEDTPEARSWADEQNDRIEAGRAADVIAALLFLKPHRKAAAELVDALSTYITNNLDRMDYPTYIEQGFISSRDFASAAAPLRAPTTTSPEHA